MKNIDHYAVFGYPIAHSKSPHIHRLFAEQTGQRMEYSAQAVPPDNFHTAVQAFIAAGGKGLNCTVPLKELAWKFADQLTERARIGKAVNTLALQTDGALLGDNTDGVGLVVDLTINHSIPLSGKHLLILGAGGAARGIIAPLLEKTPASIVIANRTVEKAKTLATEFADGGNIRACGFDELQGQRFQLILNATSASLSDQLPPLPEDILAENAFCYDLAYGDEETVFVRWGLSRGAVKSLDGLGMLVEQAAEAFKLWRHVRPDTGPVIRLLNNERLAHNAS